MKRFFKIFILGVAFLSIWGIFTILRKPTTLYPLPYTFVPITYADQSSAEKSDILIVGDRMGVGLENLNPSLQKILSKDFSVQIFNWAEENEGLHRTINKLLSLKRYPPIIIYQGASKEFFENKFSLEQSDTFIKNLEKFHNPNTLSLMMAFPMTSKLIYQNGNLIKLGPNLNPNRLELSSEDMQKTAEMEYMLFELEMEKLTNIAANNNFSLFLLTTPLNLKINPKEICSNSTSPSLEEEQREISKMLKEGRSKEALERAIALGNIAKGNAANYFLLGTSLESLGRFEEAAEAYSQGTAFDCYPWRSNLVFNNIIRTMTGRKNVYIVDFDKFVNQNFGLRDLFLDEIFPKGEFYDLLGEEIAPMISKILKR